MRKKIIFVTGTRADFGKMKSIITNLQTNNYFQVYVFITGMHLLKEYGFTWQEVKKSKIKNIIKFKNQNYRQKEDVTFSKTIVGFAKIIKKIRPNLVIVHGDRVEAFAATVSSILNDTLVGHIEGGEISGTKDELIRHSISKLSTFHFVSNLIAKKRLLQLGENKKNIFVTGSPEMDIIHSNSLPSFRDTKSRYNIPFSDYAIFIFHPVTDEIKNLDKQINSIFKSLIESKINYIVIHPNNDPGSIKILNCYKKNSKNTHFKFYPSMRFEHYITILKNSLFIIGNSSSGVREAPSLGIPSINIGNRQNNRSNAKSIVNADTNSIKIQKIIKNLIKNKKNNKRYRNFGTGNSSNKIMKIFKNNSFWKTNHLKQFNDLY